MLSSLRPLRHRDFALVWCAALVSNVGSWMQTVTVGVLVTARTGSAGWTGLVAAAAFVPIGLLSPVGGALADRVDRRRWLLATTVGETAFATALTVLAATGRASPGIVTLLVLGGGSSAAIGFPAYQAMLPDLVETGDLGAAISLSSAQFNLGRVVGPAIAGVVVVAGGYAWAFGINAASFGATVVALLLVRLPAVVPAPAEPILRRLRDGMRTAGSEPHCRLAIALIAVTAVTASPFIALVPAMAIEIFHSGAGGTSVLVTAQGVGAVAGALGTPPAVARLGRRRVLVADFAALCLLLGVYASSPGLWVGAVALALVGATYIGILSGLNTLVQLHAPPGHRGRVLGVYMMGLGLLYPVGALAQGAVATTVGLRTVTSAGAALLAVVTAAVWWRRGFAVADDPAPAPVPVPAAVAVAARSV